MFAWAYKDFIVSINFKVFRQGASCTGTECGIKLESRNKLSEAESSWFDWKKVKNQSGTKHKLHGKRRELKLYGLRKLLKESAIRGLEICNGTKNTREIELSLKNWLKPNMNKTWRKDCSFREDMIWTCEWKLFSLWNKNLKLLDASNRSFVERTWSPDFLLTLPFQMTSLFRKTYGPRLSNPRRASLYWFTPGAFNFHDICKTN